MQYNVLLWLSVGRPTIKANAKRMSEGSDSRQ